MHTSRDLHHLRVGIVGYGLGGATFHAPLVSVTPGLTLAAIVTRDPGRRADALARYPGVALADDLTAMLALGIDLVVITSPNVQHAPMAREAIARGCHVVVDKPFATTAAEAAELGALAAGARVLAIPFQNRRWDGDFLTLRQLMAAGTLGRVHRLESRFERWRDQVKPRWTVPRAREEAEGIVYDIGSHLVDQARVLLGPVRTVHAELTRVRAGLAVEDEAFLALTHEGGARSHLYMSAAAPLPGARFTLSGERGAYRKHGLDGQEAALKAGGSPRAAGWGAEPAAQWGTVAIDGVESPVETVPGAYGAFYEGVHAAITTGATPPVSGADAVATLAIIEAAFRSDAESVPVAVVG